jgi:hypothetical protein
VSAVRDIAYVRDTMLAFAARTGLSEPKVAPRRYLWTDAHAVCNFISLYETLREQRYRDLATALVDQVHHVLGRHREDDSRSGWISGLDETEGRRHPTAGGLRIGKQQPERRREDPPDEQLEWERDGQYFHYLTKWMHALCRVAAVTGEARYNTWALELAQAAWRGFLVPAAGGKRLYWKMSIDLDYPLVASSGHHDPLDGYITFKEISASTDSPLGDEIAGLGAMIGNRDWTTRDPLGIGGLLFDASRVAQLTVKERMSDEALAESLLAAADRSLATYVIDSPLDLPAGYRLAFRELGLAIGLHGLEVMAQLVCRQEDRLPGTLGRRLETVKQYTPLAATIEKFWRDPDNQAERSWQDHLDINAVMLATSLLPGGFLAT